MAEGLIGDALLRFLKDPVRLIRLGIDKTLIGPLKYGRGGDYDAARYWGDRLSKYADLRGPGCEGLSPEENRRRYEEVADALKEVCRRRGVQFGNARVLEIGPGTGYYARLLHGLGVKRYTGADITDACFQALSSEFPEYEFRKADITSEPADGPFDLVLMIDVVVHIVTEAKFEAAMENVKTSLKDGGTFIVSPVLEHNKKYLFYNRVWSRSDFMRCFKGYAISEHPLAGCKMLAISRENG